MGEGDEKVIDKMRAPTRAGELSSFPAWDLHLREEEAFAPKIVAFLAPSRAASVDPPIPQGEDDDVREPEKRGGKQELKRGLPVRRKRVYQQHDRGDERHGDERADGKAEDAVELQFAEAMAYNRWHEQHTDERGQQPGRPNDERPGQRKVNRGDGDKSQ